MGDSERSPSSGLAVDVTGSSLVSGRSLESDTCLFLVFLGECGFPDVFMDARGRVGGEPASEVKEPRSVFCRSFFIPEAFPDTSLLFLL